MKDPTSPPSDESRIQAYVAGRLDSAQAEAFEQRMFADDELAAEVQRALEIRAATLQVAVKRESRGAPRNVLFGLAVAAGVAALTVSIVWLQQPPTPPVFRGVEQRMGLEVELDGTALRARWQAIPAAVGYELQVLAGDGRVLSGVETDDTTATLDLSVASAPAFIEVSALDGLGQTLQRSERVALPNR